MRALGATGGTGRNPVALIEQTRLAIGRTDARGIRRHGSIKSLRCGPSGPQVARDGTWSPDRADGRHQGPIAGPAGRRAWHKAPRLHQEPAVQPLRATGGKRLNPVVLIEQTATIKARLPDRTESRAA
ncbi:hypothetical protein GCM10010250_40260 [Streptomyces althioticus]|nr:hypothetical protein GCM10010250_40260 [Streptomyces althioticus]GGT55031.1 hypothetical protein GCM10010243_36820 [Streptomyces matensis]